MTLEPCCGFKSQLCTYKLGTLGKVISPLCALSKEDENGIDFLGLLRELNKLVFVKHVRSAWHTVGALWVSHDRSRNPGPQPPPPSEPVTWTPSFLLPQTYKSEVLVPFSLGAQKPTTPALPLRDTSVTTSDREFLTKSSKF